MSIYSSAVKKPVTTIMIFVAVIVLGIFSLINLPIDMYPEIELPAITIFTTYNGASAADIETNLSVPIENALNTVDNLKEITSTSRDNMSVVMCEFDYGSDLSAAANDIRDALSFIEEVLPEGADKPQVIKLSTNMMPIIFYAVTADESYQGIDKLLEERVISPLNRIEGVGSVSLLGVPTREVAVEVDPLKLQAYNMTVEQIGGILAAENFNLPIGNIDMGKLNYPLRVQGEFESSDLVKDIVVGNQNGRTIYLKDIATVRDSLREMTVDQKINGKPGISMMVMKQSGANSVQVAREVKKQIEELQKTLPSDIKFQAIFDTSDFIVSSINNLAEALFFAFVFVVLVVLFFLGRWRATIIIIVTIPISLITGFIYLYLTGSSINIISLSSLSIAIGMVVDDAIVVLENITRHIERGSSPREAAIYATNEVWLAVIVTTLAIVTVFMPMTMVGGMTGILFRPLGWIVSLTIVVSTIAAISLIPMMSSKMLKLKEKNENREPNWYDRNVIVWLDKLDSFYERTLRWSLLHKKTVIFTGIAIFLGSILLAFTIGTEFMPQSDDGYLTTSVELQSGTNVNETVKIARQIDSIFYASFPDEIDLMSTSAGSDDAGGIAALFTTSGSNIINYDIGFVDSEDRDRTIWELSEVIRQKLEKIPEITNFTITEGGGMSMTSSTVDVEIYGYDIDMTTKLANEVADRVKKIEGARDVQISREKAKPELRVELDREKMSEMGLNTAMVATSLYNRIIGMTATKYRELGDEYNIVIRLKKNFRNSIEDIENISLVNQSGKTVKLSEVANVREYYSPPNIERKRRERIVTVSATPYKVALGTLASKIQSEVNKMDIPPEVLVDVGGAYEDQMESFTDLAMLMVLSLILVYIVMASQFESFRMPYIIMFSIPFAFSGVILALWLTGTNLSVIAALGAVMLIGIVVKNAIVLVDYINLMRDRGYTIDEAIAISGKLRLRPVLMTALTTILGMLPLAMSTGEGSEVWSPMGISVIGGLVFSTVITMVIVPVGYRIFAPNVVRHDTSALRKSYRFMDNGNNNDNTK